MGYWDLRDVAQPRVRRDGNLYVLDAGAADLCGRSEGNLRVNSWKGNVPAEFGARLRGLPSVAVNARWAGGVFDTGRMGFGPSVLDPFGSRGSVNRDVLAFQDLPREWTQVSPPIPEGQLPGRRSSPSRMTKRSNRQSGDAGPHSAVWPPCLRLPPASRGASTSFFRWARRPFFQSAAGPSSGRGVDGAKTLTVGSS